MKDAISVFQAHNAPVMFFRKQGPSLLLLAVLLGVVSAAAITVVLSLTRGDRPPLSSGPDKPATAEKSLSLSALQNAKYPSFEGAGADQFVEGSFKEGAISRRVLAEPVAFGDGNGDSQPDAAIIVTTNTGGSGTFVQLALVLNHNGAPGDVVLTDLGDRVVVKSLSIESGAVTVDLLTHAPVGSPQFQGQCCPNVSATWRYRLTGNQLAKLP